MNPPHSVMVGSWHLVPDSVCGGHPTLASFEDALEIPADAIICEQ